MGNLPKCALLIPVSHKLCSWSYIFQLYINDLADDIIICNVAIYADDTTLYAKCDQLASELDSNLPDRAEWGRK